MSLDSTVACITMWLMNGKFIPTAFRFVGTLHLEGRGWVLTLHGSSSSTFLRCCVSGSSRWWRAYGGGKDLCGGGDCCHHRSRCLPFSHSALGTWERQGLTQGREQLSHSGTELEEQGGLDVESQIYQLQDLGNDTQQGCEMRSLKSFYCPECCFCIQGSV